MTVSVPDDPREIVLDTGVTPKQVVAPPGVNLSRKVHDMTLGNPDAADHSISFAKKKGASLYLLDVPQLVPAGQVRTWAGMVDLVAVDESVVAWLETAVAGPNFPTVLPGIIEVTQ